MRLEETAQPALRPVVDQIYASLCPGHPRRGLRAPSAPPRSESIGFVCTARLYGCAWCLTARNGGFRPGFRAVQFRLHHFGAV
jgi:hypothetical protein